MHTLHKSQQYSEILQPASGGKHEQHAAGQSIKRIRASFNDLPCIIRKVRARQQTQLEDLDQTASPERAGAPRLKPTVKLRCRFSRTTKERVIHEHRLVPVLRQLSDEIDAAVLDGYGWSDLLPLLQVAMDMDARVPPAHDAQARPHRNPLPNLALVGAGSRAMLSAAGGNGINGIARERAPTREIDAGSAPMQAAV